MGQVKVGSDRLGEKLRARAQRGSMLITRTIYFFIWAGLTIRDPFFLSLYVGWAG